MKEKSEIIGDALDRFQEAHFWIHMMEMYYHSADPFRWYLNVFLKSIKEVPPILSMNLQNNKEFKSQFGSRMDELKEDILIKYLSKQRDFVVHRGTLKLNSSGNIGITEGRGLKLGFSFPIDPSLDSDAAMDHFVYVIARTGDFFGMLAEDEESLPCVERIWKLPQFDEEIIEICSNAWLKVGELISDVVEWLGEEKPNLNLSCRHSNQQVNFKLYERKPLRDKVRRFRSMDDFIIDENAKDAQDLSE